MRLGFHTMNTPVDLPLGELAELLESRNYESLWAGEHAHIPASRRTPYPGGGDLPETYWKMMDPLVSLASVVRSTVRLRLGTAVLLPLERDVLVLAKELATLDRLSGGRVVVGMGVGWNREEMEDHRVCAWPERFHGLVETTEALRRLWTDSLAAFDGKFLRFDECWSEPKPAQPGGPQILFGVSGKRGLAAAREARAGWMPIFKANHPKAVDAVERYAREGSAGDVSVVSLGRPSLEWLRTLSAVGVERVVVGMDPALWGNPDLASIEIERCSKFIEELEA